MKPVYQGESLWPPIKVVTQNEFDQLPDAKKIDGMYAVMPDQGIDTAGCTDIYSTQEQVIGRWVNGKPIYRICISYRVTTTGEQVHLDTGEFDTNCIDEMINTSGSCSISNGSKQSIGTLYISMVLKDDNTLTFCQKNSSTKNLTYSGHVILEYTKTTDQGEEDN